MYREIPAVAMGTHRSKIPITVTSAFPRCPTYKYSPHKAVEVFGVDSAPWRASQSPFWSTPVLRLLTGGNTGFNESTANMIWDGEKKTKTFPQVSKSIEMFLTDMPQS